MTKLTPVFIMGHVRRDGAVYRATAVETESGHADILFTRIGKLEFLRWRVKRAILGLWRG